MSLAPRGGSTLLPCLTSVVCRRSHPGARRDHRLDAPAHVEVARDTHPSGRRTRREVVEDPIDHALVKNPLIAEAPEIQLQALQFDAHSVWHIRDRDRREIRSTAA